MYARLDECVKTELAELTDTMDAMADTGRVDLKNMLLHSCANVFMSYFCSTRFARTYDRFREFVRNFDEVFYEVNQGSACDFLPGLTPLYYWHFRKIRTWSAKIRDFMETEIFDRRVASRVPGTKPVDFVDTLVDAVAQPDRDDGFDLNTGLFSLEDIIGGHSAVTNFIVKTLAFIVDRPDVQQRVQEEADAVVRTSGSVGLADRAQMPYTEAVVYESLRLIASPIVPHLTNRDTSVDGKRARVASGTTESRSGTNFFFFPCQFRRRENPERHHGVSEQLQSSHESGIVDRPGTLLSGQVRQRGRPARKTRTLHTVQRRQKVVHGLQTGAAHIGLYHRHVVEQVHVAARRGRFVRSAQRQLGTAVRHVPFPRQAQKS